MDQVTYDNHGKVSLDGIYNLPDPVGYFSTLSHLGYRIPQAARPIFRRMVAARREARGETPLRMLDLGCSYGVNAALVKHGLTMADLFRLYDDTAPGRARLLDRDRDIYDDPDDPDLEVIGLDVAENAVRYAVAAGALDAGVTADLEVRDPNAAEAAKLEGTDMIVSTGCFGYVTDVSLRRLMEASGGSRPWMAHFVLRMFDFEEAGATLAQYGYVTEKVEGLHAQRRFASDEERVHVLENLTRRGIDPTGAEADGWYFAELHVARPQEDALPLERIARAAAVT